MTTTRIGTFNVENMFDRPKAMSHETWAAGAPVLRAHARLNELIQEEQYTESVKAEMLSLLDELGLLRSDQSTYARIRKIRGRFLTRKRTGETLVVAAGRATWIGWIELVTEPVSALAMRHTAMVMRDVGAQVLGVVEAESRPLLEQFSSRLLADPEVAGTPYDQVHLIDGNDERGIDVGLLTRDRHEVVEMRTHIYDRDSSGVIFSRDCAEYHLRCPDGDDLIVLVNHLKSKGYGRPGDPQGAKRRFRQAARLAQIYNDLEDAGARNIAVVGDLNDDPTSEALSPLFGRTPLRDISEHTDFEWDKRRGTYKSGNERAKIDYVLLSPDLFAKATGGGVFRRGVWRGSRTRDKWDIYATLTAEHHAASDHAAIYADIDWTR